MQQDELLGFWENDAEDGSGLHAIWGYGIEFFENGEGVSHNWGSQVKPENKEEKIYWKRNGEKTISMKLGEDDSWDDIEYEISDFTGAYSSKWFKLVEKGKTEFWISPEPLYRKKEQ